MHYHTLAMDFDGTLAQEGRVRAEHITRLKELRNSGRKLILVTGRRLDDLAQSFEHFDLFDRIVAENGALLLDPASHTERRLGEPPPEEFIENLRSATDRDVAEGKCIVATWRPAEEAALRLIREMGLELQLIFNKGAVMILPSGLNKATGLVEALHDLGMSRHNLVAVGDAENDHALLSVAAFSVAVANSIPSLKEEADFVTRGDHGDGVIEIVNYLLDNDLKALEPRTKSKGIALGTTSDGNQIRISPSDRGMLICGPSGSGKSWTVTYLLEQFCERGFQFCLIDPEGDYEHFESAIILGDSARAPTINEFRHALQLPSENVILNLLGMPNSERPIFCTKIIPHLQELRATTGRPHWTIIDEAHYLLPHAWDGAVPLSRDLFHGLILVTVHPDGIASSVLPSLDIVAALGEAPERTIGTFCKAINETAPVIEPPPEVGENAVIWFRHQGLVPHVIRLNRSKQEHQRHIRKYAEGDLGAYHSFYFTGPHGKLNLKAHNLIMFTHIADGIDDETWFHHLRRHDFSRWVRSSVKDQQLADQIEAVESDSSLSSPVSRKRIRESIMQRYCASA